MGLWPNEIMTPLHVHGARTPEEYRALQRKFIKQGRIARPALAWSDPAVAPIAPPVFIAGGKWVVRCLCANCPSVHPVWRLACCFECGAIYEDLQVPEAAAAIAATLLERAHPSQRNWLPSEDLVRLEAETARLTGREARS
jgi:hypothetical protein